nr:DUF433 domain-containing protein [Salinibacter ruber]
MHPRHPRTRIAPRQPSGEWDDRMTPAEIVEAYSYLDREDVQQALQYAAWLTEEKVDADA